MEDRDNIRSGSPLLPATRTNLFYTIASVAVSEPTNANLISSPELRHLQQLFSGMKEFLVSNTAISANPARVDSKTCSSVGEVDRFLILEWVSDGRRGFVVSQVPFVHSHSGHQDVAKFPLRLQIISAVDSQWKPGLTLSVDFLITNSSESSITFDVHADNTAAMHGGNFMERDASTMSNGFIWVGCTQRRIENLQPQHRVTLSLTAVFLHPGVFNLNKVKFLLPQADVFTFPFESLIHFHSKTIDDVNG